MAWIPLSRYLLKIGKPGDGADGNTIQLFSLDCRGGGGMVAIVWIFCEHWGFRFKNHCYIQWNTLNRTVNGSSTCMFSRHANLVPIFPRIKTSSLIKASFSGSKMLNTGRTHKFAIRNVLMSDNVWRKSSNCSQFMTFHLMTKSG